MSETKRTVFFFNLPTGINLNYALTNYYFDYAGYTNECEYAEGIGNRKHVPRKSLIDRPQICCPYVDKILNELKKEVIDRLIKEYKDDNNDETVEGVYYMGNFKEPIIKDEICSSVKVSIVHEKVITDNHNCKKILRYLSIELSGERLWTIC